MKKSEFEFLHDMLTKLDDRLDDMDSKLHSLDKTADLQRVSLDEHIRRTHLLEVAVSKLDSETEKALKPIQKHVSTVQTIFTFVCKVVGGIAVLVGIYSALKGL